MRLEVSKLETMLLIFLMATRSGGEVEWSSASATAPYAPNHDDHTRPHGHFFVNAPTTRNALPPPSDTTPYITALPKGVCVSVCVRVCGCCLPLPSICFT